jgi:molybdopterin synthase sulfur carrier subunit
VSIPGIQVAVRLVVLARLREALRTSAEDIELSPATRDVDALLEYLRGRGGAWAVELAPGRAVRVAVNHAMAEASTPIVDGDEVALFPPVTGG